MIYLEHLQLTNIISSTYTNFKIIAANVGYFYTTQAGIIHRDSPHYKKELGHTLEVIHPYNGSIT